GLGQRLTSFARSLMPTRGVPSRPSPKAGFMRDGSAGLLSAWRPTLRDSHDDVRQAWGMAAARAIDSLHNSGWLAGAIEQCSADTIGDGLRLNATPDIDALGISEDEAHELCRRIERRWRAWSRNPLECDARGKRTIGDMTDAAIRHHYAFGEAVALIPRIARPSSTSSTKVLMVSPHRLKQDSDERLGLITGVQLDGNGMPTAYRFSRRVAGFEQDLDLKARARDGRPQVVHVFDGAPDQVRGITPLAPVLKVLRQYDQLADATLTTALIQTIIAATIKSPAFDGQAFEGFSAVDSELPDEVAGSLSARASWWDGRKLDLGAHGKIAHLFPGEEFGLHAAKTPGDQYLPFSKNLLREVARCIGTTYEAMTGDYEGATYSSVRMGTSSIWFVTLRRRVRIGVPFVQPIYAAWLDEEVSTGRIAWPGDYQAFAANRAAATQAEWFGPAKPTADDLKTAKAQSERLANGTTSLAFECAEYGLDPETVMEQRQQDRRMAAKFGLPDPYQPRGGRAHEDDHDDGDEPLVKSKRRLS
ncbi:MAG TPA: phage portal protein, partial [Hyphomicrobiaceae bacterium]|nr:phage portal protein [Hyphomicrobiaceae bacterium]